MFPRENRTGDQHDAYSISAWMRQTDINQTLPRFLTPPAAVEDRALAEIEGWILGQE